MKSARKLALLLCGLLLGLLLSGAVAAQQATPRFAVMFMAPDLASHMQTLNKPRLWYEAQRLAANGYTVVYRPGTTQEVMTALLDPRVRAIVFAGHGGVTDRGRTLPTLASYSASTWQANFRLALMDRYARQGMNVDAASARGDIGPLARFLAAAVSGRTPPGARRDLP